MRKSQNSYVSDNFYQVERNDNCPCGSGWKYKSAAFPGWEKPVAPPEPGSWAGNIYRCRSGDPCYSGVYVRPGDGRKGNASRS
ncbi:SEC-C metal-binding domain-containing protein [Neomoorella carbonis]|uniref:SEC-C metal-binding domain-containing protein n=1 Tax=Neomoorella carbonis TaxID=3062783 RepID=UPI0038738DFC